jgi:hypothetical protein
MRTALESSQSPSVRSDLSCGGFSFPDAFAKKKARAQSAVSVAIKQGSLKRNPCCICLNSPAQAHHEDYGQPLEVVWLCKAHHQMLHKNPDLLHRIIKWDRKDPAFIMEVASSPSAAARTNIYEEPK